MNSGHLDSENRLLEQIESLRGYLTAVARRKMRPELLSKVGASDVVQETMIVATTKFDPSGPEGETPVRLRRWLRSILNFRLAAASRHLNTQKRAIHREAVTVEIIDRAPSPSDHAHQIEIEQSLTEALDRLPKHYRDVLLWRYWERLGYEAIGNRLGISTEAARKIGGRALIQIRSEVGHCDDSR